MDEQVVQLLLQIPLAGVVVVVVVLFLRFLEKNTAQMVTFMEQQAETNREFLKTQRDQTNQAIARLAEEQKQMREEIAKITVVMDRFVDMVSAPRKRNRNS